MAIRTILCYFKLILSLLGPQMIVHEFRVRARKYQHQAIDEAIAVGLNLRLVGE
ncbi:hypothetical protein H6G58_08135 [Arthrospira platensis FACHB-971]|jgi:predicted nucleic acid-binding protein|uniref:Transposase n=1 Tax=Limnospira platensis NIES-46 TaxID=1236695 RepID=A0A5M3TA04_LIMPL|nr:hypothetical protein [Arthrospira platensis]MBD2572993.1 hypothetical protein [Arthrospira platensis FACHB-971]MDT9184746.1 hypothetical protein [Limnospira sp. PMC 289.06]MDT9295914.1 hypothetical protein [Arthrospira platensis PCC 7345]MDT9311678.1 hypothetical protein [Limnospira sp. Paracas R14]BAI89826.1 hypothetical protein NIES39_D04080 [Arthrospira platensis NIES-39]